MKTEHLVRKVLTLLCGDLIIAYGAYHLAFWGRTAIPYPFTSGYLAVEIFRSVNHFWWLIGISQVILLRYFGLFDLDYICKRKGVVFSVFAALAIQGLVMTTTYYFSEDKSFPRSVFVAFWVINSISIISWRYVFLYTLIYSD